MITQPAVFRLFEQLKGVFYGIDITYYSCLTSCRRPAQVELQPQLGLRPNRRLVINPDHRADTAADGTHPLRLLGK